jgi:hypothetical protein
MKLLETIHNILLFEYSEKLINNLVDRYIGLNPHLSNDVIKSYIKRFKEIKDSPNIEEKNITKYSWEDLEKVVDNYQKKRVKAGKIDTSVSDSNLIYNDNNLRLYKSNSLESCVKYGNGYNFCISARGEKNQYHKYRVYKGGTIYFLFNDNLTNKMDNEYNFIQPKHVLVIIVYKNFYTITDSTNSREEEYYNLNDMILNYPWIDLVKDYLVPIKDRNFDTELINLKREYNTNKSILEKLLEVDPNNDDLISRLEELTKKFRSDVYNLRSEFNKF